MHEDFEEKMSLLLDDELNVKESLGVFQEIEKSEELKLKWGRYNIISCTLKAKTFPVVDISAQLSQRLESEAVLLAPNRRKAILFTGKTVVSALAASVAIVAVMSMSDWAAPPKKGNPVRRTVADASLPSTISPLPVAPSVSSTPNPRFNRYLVTHNESSYETGMQGILPYARVVSYDMTK